MKYFLTASSLSLFILACSMTKQPTASARLEPRSGSSASGTVQFTQLDDGTVNVKLDLTGLTPGEHGFHIHEKGDCSAADASSAGGHFNPSGAPHASPTAEMHHAGDFGNVTATPNGEIHTTLTTHSVTLTSGEKSIVGRSIVLHADPDDLTSQPSGNSGKRVGCGTIVAGMMQ